ncbi:PP2C family protein-serine/threonine phosphatase [Halonatronum saccharophilum]|uniref:PP2C family protein-serine/threonine phosphatase n=1 Tax=Halonatronum saccharophilum TaxID=150060 RepID=UPI00048472AA|nr:PP2C family protein-serine/threonine phosphatase [Halonatronum saccharophilum]
MLTLSEVLPCLIEGEEALMLVDLKKGKVVDLNNRFLDLFNYETIDLLGKEIKELDPILKHIHYDFIIKGVSSDKVYFSKIKSYRGNYLNLVVNIDMISLNESEYIIYRFTDISTEIRIESKRFEIEELKRRYKMLRMINDIEGIFIDMKSKSDFNDFIKQLLDIIAENLEVNRVLVLARDFFDDGYIIKDYFYGLDLEEYNSFLLSFAKLKGEFKGEIESFFKDKIKFKQNEEFLNFIISEGEKLECQIAVTFDNKNDIGLIQEFVNMTLLYLKSGMKKLLYIKEILNKEKMNKELDIASNIQTAFIPKSTPNHKDVDLAIFAQPANKVGGDYFGFNLKENKLNLLVSDVMGKGVPAAIVVATIHSAFNILSRLNYSPNRVLKHLNYNLYNDLKRTATFVSAFYASLDINKGILSYSNAAHNPPLIWSGEKKKLGSLSKKGILCGVEGYYDYDFHQKSLEKGDLILFYTDGLIDIINDKGKRLGLDEIKKLIEENNLDSAEDLKEKLVEKIYSYINDKDIPDDISFIVLKYLKDRRGIGE